MGKRGPVELKENPKVKYLDAQTHPFKHLFTSLLRMLEKSNGVELL